MAFIPKPVGIAPRLLAQSVVPVAIAHVDEATQAEEIPDQLSVGEGRKAVASVQVKAAPPRSTGFAGIDACDALVTWAIGTGFISDKHADVLADRLNGLQDGFELRLIHMSLERVCARSLISTRSRQKLGACINASFGRTKENFSKMRVPTVDPLGLTRGDTGFDDKLIQRGPQMVEALCAHVLDSKTPEALQSAFQSLAKVFTRTPFSRTDRTKLIAAFVRAQARLKANVIQMSGTQGLLALMPIPRPIPLTAHEKDALLQRVATVDLEALEQMRLQLTASMTSALFPPNEHKVIMQSIDMRLMTLRATA